jgi:tetratricopeptide (TPR) repeat protein
MNITNRVLALLFLTFLAVTVPSCTRLTAKPNVLKPEHEPPTAYRVHLERGVSLMWKRRYSEATEQFSEARRHQPLQAEPDYRSAQALFRIGRYEEAARACSSTLQRDPQYYDALPFCWAVRLERHGLSPAVRREVRSEIEELLAQSLRPNEVLLAASQGYSYLQEDEESAVLLLELADLAHGTSLAEEIAPSVFETIVSTKSPQQRSARAESYMRNFPDGRMAFRAARIWLRAQAEVRGKGAAPRQIPAMDLLEDGDHRQLLAAAASWLIERKKDPDRAIALLERSLRSLEEDGRTSTPPYFTEELWREHVENERGRCRYLLGRAWLQKGDLVKARPELAAALRGYADPGAVHHYFGVLEQRTGSEEEAIQHFRKALELSGALGKTEELLSSVLREARGEPAGFSSLLHLRTGLVS